MNPTEMTATQLVTAYAAGELSPVEAITSVLDRIDAADDELGAYCYLDPDTSVEQARASEARWQAGYPQGLLDGVPVSIKDIFLTDGWPTLRGSTLDRWWFFGWGSRGCGRWDGPVRRGHRRRWEHTYPGRVLRDRGFQTHSRTGPDVPRQPLRAAGPCGSDDAHR